MWDPTIPEIEGPGKGNKHNVREKVCYVQACRLLRLFTSAPSLICQASDE